MIPGPTCGTRLRMRSLKGSPRIVGGLTTRDTSQLLTMVLPVEDMRVRLLSLGRVGELRNPSVLDRWLPMVIW